MADGALSNFPTSVDQFAIKKSFDPNKATSAQDTDAIESSLHINHMFDAVINIEKNQYGATGGQVQTFEGTSGVPVTGSNLKIAYATFTAAMSGNLLTFSGTVPSMFGTNPFYHVGFAMSATTNFQPHIPADVAGVWANTDFGLTGPWNTMVKFPQLFTMVHPTGGSNFTITVKNVPIHSTSWDFSNHFTDTLVRFPLGKVPMTVNDQFWTGQLYGSFGALAFDVWNNQHILRCRTETGTNQAAVIWPRNMPVSDNSSVEFQAPVTWSFDNPNNLLVTECWNRVGPMVKFTGSITGASFYCVSVGDAVNNVHGAGSPPTTARLLRISGNDLTFSIKGGTGSSTILWGGPGTITDMLSGGLIDLHLVNTYRLIVSGSVVDVQTQSGSSWTSIISGGVTDPSPLPGKASSANPKAGWFCKAMDGINIRETSFPGNIKVTSLDSVVPSYDVTVQCLFAQIEPDSSLPLVG